MVLSMHFYTINGRVYRFIANIQLFALIHPPVELFSPHGQYDLINFNFHQLATAPNMHPNIVPATTPAATSAEDKW